MRYENFEQIWNSLCRNLSPASCKIVRDVQISKEIAILTKWNRVCPIRNKNFVYQTHHVYSTTKNKLIHKSSSPTLISTNELSNTKGEVTIKIIEFEEEKNKKYILEKWKNEKLMKSVNLYHPELFDYIYIQGSFSSLVFSEETDVVYFLAESSTEAKIKDKLRNFVYQENFGEGMTKISNPSVFLFDIKKNVVLKIFDANFKLYPYKLLLSHNGTLYFLAYENVDFLHGIKYNTNQKCGLFSYKEPQNYARISPEDKSVNDACIHPEKDLIIYLQRSIGGPHLTSVDVILFDILADEKTIIQKGVFCLKLLENCWIENSENMIGGVILNVLDGRNGKISMVCIYPTSKGWKSSTILTSENNEFSQECLCVYNHLDTHKKEDTSFIIFSKSDLFNPDKIALIQLKYKDLPTDSDFIDVESIELSYQSEEKEYEVNGKITKYFFDNNREFSSMSECSFGGLLCRPTYTDGQTTGNNLGLVVIIHGGPHSLAVNKFSRLCYALLSQNFILYFPNYRGSLGFDDKTVESILGHIGDMDVKDVHETTIKICQKEGISMENVHVSGGSHGGYIGSLLISKYPEFYKSCCLRNPVIDLLSMYVSTDIPEWVFVEAGIEYYSWKHLTPEYLTKMYKGSPIYYANSIKTPVLLMLGEEDKRVPPICNGMSLFRLIKSNKGDIEMVLYPGEGHPLDGVAAEMNTAFKIINFHLDHNTSKEY